MRFALAAAILCAACYATHRRSAISEGLPADAAASLAVRLEVPAGEVTLRPGRPGRLYDVDLVYCRTHFTPRLSRRAEAGAVALALALARRRRPDGRAPAGEEPNRVVLGLGPDRGLDLTLDLGPGRHHADLGGLRLRGLVLRSEGGTTTVDFERPVAGDLPAISLEGGPGRVRVRRLGNASPGLFTLGGGTGEFEIDLDGSFRRDAMLRLDVRLGDVMLRAPRALALEIDTGERDAADLRLPEFDRTGPGRYVRGPARPGAPRVSVRVGPGIGAFGVVLEG
jgi:hypothetical protein